MDDLIDRKKLINWFSAYGLTFVKMSDVIKAVKDATAVDAVPVVRCKDCIGKSTWYNDAEYGFAICGMSGMYPKSEDGYCSYGERKIE